MRFAELQRAVFARLGEVAAELEEGMSEREVGRRVHRGLRELGVRAYFHAPVALFGERTTYPGDFGAFEALPTERTLRAGDPVILDAAPIIDGLTIDAAFTCQFRGEGVPEELDAALFRARELIVEGARARRSLREIARAVDDEIRRRGLVNCHEKHIGAVLGHRLTAESSPWLRGRRVFGLGPRQVGYFVMRSAAASLGFRALTPNWNAKRQSDYPVPDGLWAVEPHVATRGFGAKFEEILLVQGADVRYLDEDLPHTRRFAERLSSAPAEP